MEAEKEEKGCLVEVSRESETEREEEMDRENQDAAEEEEMVQEEGEKVEEEDMVWEKETEKKGTVEEIEGQDWRANSSWNV